MSSSFAMSAGLRHNALLKPASERLVAVMIAPCFMQSATTACASRSSTGSRVAPHQCSSAEETNAANVANRGMALLEELQVVYQSLTHVQRIFEEALVF